MSTFNWLLVAHFVGDWMLQTNWMADGKRKRVVTLPGVAHFGLYTATVLGALWLSGVRGMGLASYLWIGSVVFVSHWLIDTLDVARHWLRLCLGSEREMVRMVVDQALHLLVFVVLLELFQ